MRGCLSLLIFLSVIAVTIEFIEVAFLFTFIEVVCSSKTYSRLLCFKEKKLEK